MVDKKITELTELEETPAGGDMIAIVDDPDGSAETKKISFTNLVHTQGTDTTMGTLTADLDFDSSYQCTSLQAPGAEGEAIRQTAKITEAKMEAADDHVNDNTQAHTDYLLNSGADIAVGPLTVTADNSTADQAYIPMVLYNTDDTPPAASGFPVGTLYVQYTA